MSAKPEVTLGREPFPNDGTVRWTVEVLWFFRRLTVSWHGPIHFHHPDVPEYMRKMGKP